ncbi:hypothetical protein COV19_06605 [Candidatus Woesearchaeota archaeon CG10_big_fil_rev_8_21_14_0_10_44_13]|nr:MAG: hypothetical protein COV19_06605 [Candidatus Woesearchaeota archaeon CG10_big_fil_rev_8_21_14_0_10_44_13]
MREEKVYFRNRKGEKLCGVLTVPEDTSKKCPLIVLCHGFSSSKDSKTYVFLAKELFKLGRLSLRFDFYGHGESEGKFEDITLTEGSQDILSAIEYVKGLDYVGRIGLFGTSFGGVCSVIATSKTNQLSALALKCPALEMGKKRREEMGLENLSKWKNEGFMVYKNHEGKKLRLNYSFYEDAITIDAYKEAKKISLPVLIVHGDNDESVPVQQSEKLAGLIGGARLEIIKGANHFFGEKEHYDLANRFFIKFFKEVLK